VKFSMKALARIGIGIVTALGTAALAYVSDAAFVAAVVDVVGQPVIAGTLAALVAWAVGKLVGLIPKAD